MQILAFDAAAAACSAVRMRDDVVMAREWQAMKRGHSEALVPMIERVMHGAAYSDLSAIGVAVGPGAFTGLRIALATARGLALATGVPAIGVTSFAVAAHMAADLWNNADGCLVIALETKRADFYLQAFDAAGRASTEPASVSGDNIAEWLPAGERRIAVAGDAAARLIAALPADIEAVPVGGAELPDAKAVAAIVSRQVDTAQGRMHQPLRPLYLRPPDVTLPKARLRGRT